MNFTAFRHIQKLLNRMFLLFSLLPSPGFEFYFFHEKCYLLSKAWHIGFFCRNGQLITDIRNFSEMCFSYHSDFIKSSGCWCMWRDLLMTYEICPLLQFNLLIFFIKHKPIGIGTSTYHGADILYFLIKGIAFSICWLT